MHDFISIKIIHLAKRSDRLLECNQALRGIGLLNHREIFFQAKEIESLGARGCALSHAMALSEFLFNTDKPLALILEDDFEIRNSSTFWSDLDNVIKNLFFGMFFCLGITMPQQLRLRR